MSEVKNWYYANGNNAEGPYSENEMRELFKNGVINKDTYIVNNLTMHEWGKYSDCIPIPDLPKIPKPSSVPPINGGSQSSKGNMPPVFTRSPSSFLEEEIETVVIPANNAQKPRVNPNSSTKADSINKKPAPPKQSEKPVSISVSINKDELSKKLKNIEIKNGVNVGSHTFSQNTLIVIGVSVVTLILMFTDFFKGGYSGYYDSITATLFEMSDDLKTLGNLAESTELSMIGTLAIAAVSLHVGALILYVVNNKKYGYFSMTMEVLTIVILIVYYILVKSIWEELSMTVSLTGTGILCFIGCVATLVCFNLKEKKVL